MSISADDGEMLKTVGFTDEEIDFFARATYDTKGMQVSQPPINFNEPHWQEAIRDRRQLVDQMIGQGWTLEQIGAALQRWYAREDEDPYVWIEATYKKGMVKGSSDFKAMIAATKRINKLQRYQKEVKQQYRYHAVGVRQNTSRRSDLPPRTNYTRTNHTSGFSSTNRNSRRNNSRMIDEE